MSFNHCGIVILAAGSSSRMGKPKQLLEFEGETFITRIVKTAISTELNPILVVLGANHELIKAKIENFNLDIIYNENWASGMASSIVKGVEVAVEKYPETDALIFLVADQPFVDVHQINSLLEKQKETSLAIAACSYNGHIGTPALFYETFFSELRSLKGDVGARKIIEKHKDQVAIVNFEKGIIDIDTEEDYAKLC